MYLVSFASVILQGPPNDPDGSGKVQGVIYVNDFWIDTIITK